MHNLATDTLDLATEDGDWQPIRDLRLRRQDLQISELERGFRSRTGSDNHSYQLKECYRLRMNVIGCERLACVQATTRRGSDKQQGSAMCDHSCHSIKSRSALVANCH